MKKLKPCIVRVLDVGYRRSASSFPVLGQWRMERRKRELSWNEFRLRSALDLQTFGNGMRVPVVRGGRLDS